MHTNPGEALEKWYGQVAPISEDPRVLQEWQSFLDMTDRTPTLLESVLGGANNIVGKDLCGLIAQSGAAETLIQHINSMIKFLQEQTAIWMLRNYFGEADETIDGALDAFVDLARDEKKTREAAQEKAAMSEVAINQGIEKIFGVIDLFVAQRLAELKVQKAAKQKTLEKAIANTEGDSQLMTLLEDKKPVVDKGISRIDEEEQTLNSLLGQAAQICGYLRQGVGSTISVVARQSTEFRELQPLAA